MRFSIFDDDGTMGGDAWQLAVYRGTVVLPLGKSKAQVADELKRTLLYFGFPVESVSIPSTGVSVNPASWTIKIRIPCLSVTETARELRKGVESLGEILRAAGGTSHIVSSSVERQCVANKTSVKPPVNTGGVRKDDTPDTPKDEEGVMDWLKQADITTMVLIGVGTALLLKRL